MKCSALIAIDEWMIFGNAKCICRRKRREVSLAIMPTVLRPCECRFQKSLIPNSFSAAEQRQLFGVHVNHLGNIEPARLVHFAKALKVS